MVEYLKYKGEKLPVRICYSVIKKTNQDLIAAGKAQVENPEQGDQTTDQLELMLYYGLQKGYKLEEKKFEFTKADMEDILDDCFFDFVNIIKSFHPEKEKTDNESEKGK